MVENEAESSLIEEHESEETLIEIPDDLEDPLYSKETCISRVPNSICREKREAYSPQVISIGPLHYGEPQLWDMEKRKFGYLKLFCQRVQGKSQKQVVNHLSRIIMESKDKIRCCYYVHTWTWNPTVFVKMVLLDSVFIIENLLREMEYDKYEDDVLISERVSIYFDFILLENQLPYFIVKRLYDETQMPKPCDFDTLAGSYLSVNPSSSSSREVRHFVDMLRLSYLSKTNRTYQSLDDHKLKYSATKLHQAGVNFAAEEDQQVLILDVEFVDGVLILPVLYVNQYFEAEFRNVMAFEQIHHPFEAEVCSFFFFLADLINNEEDVELLVDGGIIVHWLGSNRMFVDFINNVKG